MKERFQLKETIVTIIADESDLIEVAKEAIHKHRTQLEIYIYKDPYFRMTLESYDCEEDAPEVVQRLVRAGNAMEIGPMSAVAGTLSSLAVEAMVDKGATHAMVDNGGDIALINDQDTVVGVYAGNSPIRNMGFVLEPSDRIRGVCTSSGTVGPSISFGFADAAIVFSDDVSLADAAATALANATDVGHDGVENAFEVVSGIEMITGALVIQGKHMGMWGDVPRITQVDVRYECIAKG